MSLIKSKSMSICSNQVLSKVCMTCQPILPLLLGVEAKSYSEWDALSTEVGEINNVQFILQSVKSSFIKRLGEDVG